MASCQLSLLPPAETRPSLRDVAEAVKTAGLDGLPDARRRADEARYQEVHVKSALTQTTGMPFRWALNPYRGCTHACEYCYARKYQRHLELSAGDEFSSLIFVKTNLPEVLAREVTRRTWAHESVAVGTATDPYQPIEGHYRLTRRAIEILTASRTPFSITTKGPMVVRDIAVLADATRHAGCQVYVSVPSVDETAWSKLEPGTASPAQRLRAVRQLIDAGIDAGVLMMPLVPGITTSKPSVDRTLQAIADAGARFIGANVAHLEEGVREHFFAFLRREYPQLVDGYARLYPRGYAPKGYVSEILTAVKATAARLGATGRAASPSAP
jgi:DNA repair photolyase